MSDDEQTPVEIDPAEASEQALDPAPGFGEQDEAAQEDEWAEDAAEGGE